MNEAKIRKYIRARLEEKAGKRKPVLNESAKTDKIKKLDKMIDEQMHLFESLMKENADLNEVFGWSNAEKFKKVDPNNPASVDDAFNKIFSQALRMAVRQQHAARMTPEIKYNLMQQGMETDGLKNPSFGTQGGQYVYAPLKTASQFKSGGTGGKTGAGGV